MAVDIQDPGRLGGGSTGATPLSFSGLAYDSWLQLKDCAEWFGADDQFIESWKYMYNSAGNNGADQHHLHYELRGGHN